MTTPTVIGAGPNEAGGRVRREDAGGPVVPASIGNTAAAGPFRWGPVATGVIVGGDDSVVVHVDRPGFVAWRGGDMEVDPCPTACLDFFDESEGAGSLATLRLTDGNEAKSGLDLYDRTADFGDIYLTAYPAPNKIATVSGLYPGKLGGRKAYLAGVDVSSFSAGAGTFDTGVATVKDVWLGATLSFETSTISWKVTGNDAAGVLSILANSSDPTPASAATKKWWIILDNIHINNTPDGLSAWIGVANRKVETEFSFKLFAHGEGTPRIDLADSSGDSAVETYLTKVLNDQQKSGLQLLTSVAFEAHVPSDKARPANWVGLPLAGASRDLSETVIEVQTWFWEITTGTLDGYLDAGSAETDFVNIVYGADPIRHKAVLTYDGAGNFTVQYRLWDDTVIADFVGGAADTPFVPAVPFLAEFLVRAGSTETLNDELTIWFSPLPLKLRDRIGVLWAHAVNRTGTDDLRKQFRIVGNTATSITLRSGHDLADTVEAPLPAVGIAVSPETYDFTGGGLTFIYDPDGEGDVTLTSTLSGGAETAAAVAADLNTQETAAHPSEERLVFFDNAGTLNWRGTRSYGAAANHIFKAASTVPFSPGGDATFTGADGDLLAVSYTQNLQGGRDGVADLGVALEYENIAWDVVNSPFIQLRKQNLGLITILQPGNVDVPAQNAAIAFAHSESLWFVGEIPAATATEEAARAFVVDNIVNSGSASNVFLWDAFAQRRRAVVPGSEDLFPIVGAYAGMNARLARDFDGYHKAPSGLSATLQRNFSRLASIADPQRPRFKQDAPLTAVGIVPIQQQGQRIYAWGDQGAMANLVGTAWAHKERVVRHIVRELLFLSERYIFEIHDASLRSRVRIDARGLLRPKFQAGWFFVPDGAGFDDIVAVRSDSQLNPVAVQQMGKLIAVIQILGIVDTVKIIEFALFPGSVAVIQE